MHGASKRLGKTAFVFRYFYGGFLPSHFVREGKCHEFV